jgi:putative Mg2+ transporter-C (MgtC) family protein
MTIPWTTFAIRLLVALFLAVGIGIERQWLKTRGVLKTNVLVSLGSAMFVMLSIMTPGDASPTRISAQIVSGVGFLGGGVILREGTSVRGINTAATLWCAAAIGTLVGSGFLVQAYVSTVVVIGANLLLRPLVEAFKHQRDDEDMIRSLPINNQPQVSSSEESEFNPSMITIDRRQQYSVHLTCAAESEVKILELIVNFAREKQLVLLGVQSKNLASSSAAESEIEIKANFAAYEDEGQTIDSIEMIKVIKAETKVNSVNWQLISTPRI